MRALKNSLLATSTLAGVAALFTFITPAAAQDAVVVAQEQATMTTEVEELVITGTRLRLPDYVQPNPIVSMSAAQIESAGVTNLGDFLQEVPALVNSLDLADGADTSTPSLAGLNLLDLRNLGTDRTLVLVNGRRHVASYPGSSAVDVNTIPIALIERVDVLTGGTSAVYGADSVSGVVNFIMKRDFDGIDVRAQHSWTEEGGGGANYFSALIGRNLFDDRINVTAGYEYNNQDRLTFRDRSYTYPGQRTILISNPDDPGTFDSDLDDPDIVDNILTQNVRYIDTSPGGSIYTNLFANTEAGVSFLGNGQPFEDGIYAGGFFMIGGSGSLLDLFNDDLIPGIERHTFNFTGRFDVSDRLSLWAEAKVADTTTGFYAQPSYEYGLYISPENPFVPASVIADAEDVGGLLTNTLFNFGTDEDPFLLTPWQAYGMPAPGVLVARDNFDLGTQNYDVERQTLRLAMGATLELTPHIDFEVSAVAGKATQDLDAHNVRINERFLAATDVVIDPATDEPVCRSNLDPSAAPVGDLFGQFAFPAETFGTTFTPGPNSGCLPLNIFGEGVADQAAIDWINTSSKSTSEIRQDVVTAFLSGDTTDYFSLPAGPVGFVLGAEYRKEKSLFVPSPVEALAEELEDSSFSNLGRAVRTKGVFDVREAFTEISVPVLRDLPWAQSLIVRGAYRWSDYSNMGETHTWDFGGKWQITSDVMLRATRARAVRAPNISDLYLGRQQTFATFADPCSAENQLSGENPELRQANCAAALEALGVDPDTFINNSSEAVAGFITGNPDLAPEEADTLTYGLVLTPRWVPGLQLSVDYYDIEIDDAIQSFTGQTIVNNCYDLPQPNDFCDLIDRTPGGFNPGRIVSFEQLPQNIATYTTRGIDYTITYRLDPANFGIERDIGRVDLRLVGNILKELTYDQGGTAAPTNNLGAGGVASAPEQQVNFDATWTWNAWRVNYGLSWHEETRRFTRATMFSQPDYVEDGNWYYPAREVHDIQVRYTYDDRFSVYGGINNFTDQEPSWDTYQYPVNALGRLFYVGAQAEF